MSDSRSAFISRQAKDLGRVLDARLNVRHAQIAVHEVATKVGTFVVEMDDASRRFAEMLREVERLADCGWTVPTEHS